MHQFLSDGPSHPLTDNRTRLSFSALLSTQVMNSLQRADTGWGRGRHGEAGTNVP